MPLRFPIKFRTWESSRKNIAFPAKSGSKEVLCRLSAEALTQCCGAVAAKPEPAYRAFDCHRAAIERLASRKYDAGQLEADGTVLIGSGDFR